MKKINYFFVFLKKKNQTQHKRRAIAKVGYCSRGISSRSGKGYGVKVTGESTRAPRGPRIESSAIF